MQRVNARYAARSAEPGGAGRAGIRREIARAFEQEVEELIVAHRVVGPVAEYVRHVVREGFDVAFDLMDPTSEMRAGGQRPRS